MEVIDQVDDETAALILHLHTNDVQELLSANKGKGSHGETSDAQLAITTYGHDLQRRMATLADRHMARSLTQAVISDFPLLNDCLAEETAAASDRVLAHQLAGVNPPSTVPEQTNTNCELDDGLLARLATLYVSGRRHEDGDASSNDGEASTWAASRGESANVAQRQCTVCELKKPIFDVLLTPCGHYYCQECLSTLFELATTDEALFPPRCCRQEIPLQVAKLYLSSTLMHTFEEKSMEFSISNRTYCSQATCSAFIAPTNVNNEQALCMVCGASTCTVCKTAAHDGDCPEDTATQLVLQTAREQGWQRCYHCRRLVELDFGCNHITCPCSSQFCYVCGEPWKTCRCDQWNEERLMARANQVVNRDRRQLGVARERLVDQAVANLRARHNCGHGNWRYVVGPHRCEECYENLRVYIFECRHCHILACKRCTRNRF